MSEPAAQTVRSLLHDLEERRQIKILFAVESGSRCLTKHSANSFRLPKPTPAHKTPGKKKNVV